MDMPENVWYIEDDLPGGGAAVFRQLQATFPKIFFLVDEHTETCCLPLLPAGLLHAASTRIIRIPSGEEHKNLETCKLLWTELNRQGADRRSLLINVGGGVICDLGGLAASLFKRGIAYFHLPTTLLAMADASIGGKTGVDFLGYKNEIGLFSKPEGVLVYTGFLATLDRDQLRSGYSEIIKIALVCDERLWSTVRKDGLPGFPFPAEIIRNAVQLKQQVVEKDFREAGIRKLLNFGHTIGHALETLYLKKKKSLLHGDAVAAGIWCATLISERQTGLLPEKAIEIQHFITTLFPKILFHKSDIPELIDSIRHDKKNEGNSTRFTLLKDAGKGLIDIDVDPALQQQALQAYLLNPDRTI